MPDAYELHDGRFLMDLATQNAPGSLAANMGPVPAGKVWSVFAAQVTPSVSETRTIWFSIVTRGGARIAVTKPVSALASSVIPFAFLTEGMEIKLFPGEFLGVDRDVATAGSTQFFVMRYIETDLPYYSYYDPLKKVYSQKMKRGSISRGGGSTISGGGSGESGGGGGGGGRDPSSIPI